MTNFSESTLLAKARQFEEKFLSEGPASERPVFHLTPLVGWMNDPNGFSYFDGEYHLFFQYNPYETKWNAMHWGHAVSKDLLNWQYLPAALAPDAPYDYSGCFSGSAIALDDNQLLLMYTGVTLDKGEHGEVIERQRQCIAVGDGVNFRKTEENPVITEYDLPEGSSKVHFRDPKIWRAADGTYYSVVVNADEHGYGQVLLYSSADARQWTFEKILIANEGKLGIMWECPDFFELDERAVLIISPQAVAKGTEGYYEGNNTAAFLGAYDPDRVSFVPESNHVLDDGIDFYAPQTVRSPDGRRIMIGWLQNWDTVNYRVPGQAWFSQMSVPRELHIMGNRLLQTPVREILDLRTGEVIQDQVLEGEQRFAGISGRVIDLELVLSPVAEAPLQHFTLALAENESYETTLAYDPQQHTLTLDRSKSGGTEDACNRRTCHLVSDARGTLKLRILLDRFSAEIFINDGEQVMSTSLVTPQEATGIRFSTVGQAHAQIRKYDLTETEQ